MVKSEIATQCEYIDTAGTYDISDAIEVLIIGDISKATHGATSANATTALGSDDYVEGKDIYGYIGYKQYIKIVSGAELVLVHKGHCPTE